MMRIVSLVAVAGLAGCSTTEGFGRARQYNASKITKIQMPDDTYRVFEHPSEKTIMTVPSPAVSFGAGVASGATLGLAQVAPPEQRHEAAARQYLNDTGRQNCTITSGYLLIRPQHEFTYECPPAAG